MIHHPTLCACKHPILPYPAICRAYTDGHNAERKKALRLISVMLFDDRGGPSARGDREYGALENFEARLKKGDHRKKKVEA